MLVEQRRAALLRVEEDAVEAAVDLEHGQRREHRRSGDQQQVADHGRRPAERRQPPPGEPRGAHLAHRDHQVDREADESEHRQTGADDPGIGAVGGREDQVGERRQGGGPGLGGGVEEAGEDREPAGQVEVVGELVEPRQRHPAGADLQRDDVADQPERQGHDPEDRERGHGAGHQPVEDLGLQQVVLGHDQLNPHERELGHRERQEGERGGDVELADDLVVGAGRPLDPGLAGLAELARDDLGTGGGGGRDHPDSAAAAASWSSMTACWAAASSARLLST